MKSAILTVGTEILFGQVVNTNAAFLSENLQNLGFDVMYHYTVGDNPKRLEETLNIAFKDCDLVITTGGLGPTQDDLTKEIIGKYFGETIYQDETCLRELKEYCESHNFVLTENNIKQANLPTNAIRLKNTQGTAPGFILKNDEKIIIALPGPPREMKTMFNYEVKPFLQKLQDSVIYYRSLKFFGIGESMLETKLLPLIDGQSDPTFATYAKEGECSLRICSKAMNKEDAEKNVNDAIPKVKELVGEFLYSCDDEELIDVVGKLLLEKNITISSAESCTCGMFASTIGKVPGISQVFDRGIVTYTEKAKIEDLGIKQETLDKYTVVSPEIAIEMVEGLFKKTKSDFCISVTGFMGPGGGTIDNPVATCYIGVKYRDKLYAIKSYRKDVNREYNRHYATLKMLYEVYKNIKED